MTLIAHCLAAIVLLASVVPSVLACQSDEFWHENKSCCVPTTVPHSPSTPPPGKSCPISTIDNWYWSNDKSCCLPTAPPQSDPTCQDGHRWDEEESFCSATPSPPSGPSECADDEFWYDLKACCLPHGGPPNPPSPPTGSECPSFGWYWSDSSRCCVPSHPSPPLPQCPPGWEWIAGNYMCQPVSTSHNQQPPQPSHGYSSHGRKKRTQKIRANNLCPNDLTVCPVVGAQYLFSDYECIDTKYDLQSCGGCPSIGTGQDCTTIRGAWNVGCKAGRCTVYNCVVGYKLAINRTACIPL